MGWPAIASSSKISQQQQQHFSEMGWSAIASSSKISQQQ
jgi:hypothetical protein